MRAGEDEGRGHGREAAQLHLPKPGNRLERPKRALNAGARLLTHRVASVSRRPSVVIAADVDPRLYNFRKRPDWDVWDTLDFIPQLENALGSELPPVTWMIRCDESIRQLTGEYTSCLSARPALWRRLRDRGHEFGWHFHHWSYDERYGFDPDPAWLTAAHAALAEHYPIRATRTGWDFC